MSANNDYMFSFERPLAQYKDYIHPITGEQLTMFAERHGKQVNFKPSKIWVASRTGVNQPNISPEEVAFYISDASGRVYPFKYKYQSELLKILDRDDKNGFLHNINMGKRLKPFNWLQIEVSALTGYIFRCYGKNTQSWDDSTFKHYKTLIKKIDAGNVIGAFLPYYIAPDEPDASINKTYIGSVLKHYNQFKIGGLVLYSKENLTNPIAFIPDVDFMYHIELGTFRGLKFGEIQRAYIESFKDESFASSHKRCDAPKPADIEILEKTQPKDKEQPKNVNQKEINLEVDIEQPTKVVAENTSKTTTFVDLFTSLQNIVPKFAKDGYSNFIVYNTDVSKKESGEIQITILCNKFNNADAVRVNRCFVDNLVAKDNFKAKEAYKVTFTIIASDSTDDKYNFKTYLGLYGSTKENLLLNDTSIDRDELMSFEETPSMFLINLLGDSYNSLIDKDMLSSFDIQVGKGVAEGLEIVSEALGTTVEVDSISVDAKEYKVNFTEYIEYLSIVNTENNSLKYTLVYDSSLIDVEEDKEVDAEDYLIGYLSYTGDTGVTLSIKALCKRFAELI